ncbi:polyketide-8 synthase acyl carrier protein [Amycolatopsis coloradensis]|uniref:Polyketide-8 synthase acyl carrier protein n=1 Tax=Amycolatopsis coloradensis TaxID=76021 RepID=A0A1R0KQS4_9PSEU|nr:acyl carrier protein [Amycolatopsis coloradensis]OLZ50011.1 polyketide-8 synthase acyl carrier protein [Amycolatopsis coloradensis]
METINRERAARIKEIVCEILELDQDEVTDTSLFDEDHGADSLRSIEILAALEREYSVIIDQNELSRMVNLKSVCEVVGEVSGG